VARHIESLFAHRAELADRRGQDARSAAGLSRREAAEPSPRPWRGLAHRHYRRSREFIGLLQDLDRYYPPDCTLRLVMDNHSAHISKQTQAYFATRPNRFKHVLTPTHGSWLNRVETLLGKMARTFLRHIRVQSWEEVHDRILLGISEINAAPVVHRWKKFQALMT